MPVRNISAERRRIHGDTAPPPPRAAMGCSLGLFSRARQTPLFIALRIPCRGSSDGPLLVEPLEWAVRD